MANIVSRISPHQEHELLVKLESAGLTGPLAQKVIESPGNAKAKEIVALLIGTLPAFPSYSVSVDYDRSVEQLVDGGQYDWSNSDITNHNFSSTEKGKAQVDIYRVCFDRYVSSEQAIKEMNAQGLRPATLKELLSLGIGYPELQHRDLIIALGSTSRHPSGVLHVPYLDGSGSFRVLDLRRWDGGWDLFWRFAAVRLEPNFSGPAIKITVLTVAGQPSFTVSANLLAPEVDKQVRLLYGVQSNGLPHNWRGD